MAMQLRVSPSGSGHRVASRRGNVVAAAAAARPTLYSNPGSRGKLIEWYAAEAGVDLDTTLVDMRAGQHKTPDYLANVHPFGKVPALVDGDNKVWETGAIMLYLAAKYQGLSADGLAVVAPWVLFANSSMCDAFFNERARATQMPSVLQTLDQLLSKQPHLTGPDFCPVSDVSVGSYLLYIPLFFPTMDMSPYPAVVDYMIRLVERPGCPAAYRDGMKGIMQKSKAKPGGGLLSSLFKS